MGTRILLLHAQGLPHVMVVILFTLCLRLVQTPRLLFLVCLPLLTKVQAVLRLCMKATVILLLSSRPPQRRCRPGHKVASERAPPGSAKKRLQRRTRLLLLVFVLFVRPTATWGGVPGWCDGGHATRLDSLTPVGCAPSSRSYSAQVGAACSAETSTSCGTCSSSGSLMRQQEKGGPRD